MTTEPRVGVGPRLAWSTDSTGAAEVRAGAPGRITREWAWGGSTGAGARVCLLDSGIDADDPRLGPIDGTLTVGPGPDEGLAVRHDDEGDVMGHGTACAGIIHGLAPKARLTSIRVLGRACAGKGEELIAALEWAVDQQFDVVSLSLSTGRAAYLDALRTIADRAAFSGTTLVAAAHNRPVVSYPWSLSPVISVGSHPYPDDPERFYVNPTPPVRFYAPGVGVRVAWLAGASIVTSGNSFAAPHVAGYVARIVAKHGRLPQPELLHILAASASNASPRPERDPSRGAPRSRKDRP